MAMENHHFYWENSLFQWPFSIAMLVITRGYTAVDQRFCHDIFAFSRGMKMMNNPWLPTFWGGKPWKTPDWVHGTWSPSSSDFIRQESGADFIAMALDRNQSLCSKLGMDQKMGLSENSVPLNPMVNDHYPY